MMPRAEDSVQTKEETEYKPIGLTMFLRSKEKQAEITVAVTTDEDDTITKGLKSLINQMTQVNPERRPNALEVQREVERLREIQTTESSQTG